MRNVKCEQKKTKELRSTKALFPWREARILGTNSFVLGVPWAKETKELALELGSAYL